MTSLLNLQGNEKVLEIGTGSGYQTAILAQLARLVVTVERLPELAEKARKTLHELGYDNVRVRLAGQAIGWPLDAPYDVIMVTAGAPRVPDGLLAQLNFGGRMVIPVGQRYEQELLRNIVENLGGCRFVSLIGDEAWDSD
jgi:protein-L-isoaspartate(D-aspartate) O-methyltransferase